MSFKTVFSNIKNIFKIHPSLDVIENLHKFILDLQKKNTDLSDEIDDFKEKEHDFKEKEHDFKQKEHDFKEEIFDLKEQADKEYLYEIYTFASGTKVYKLKSEKEPTHFFCQPCFDRKKILVHLHEVSTQGGYKGLRCYSCENIFEVSHGRPSDNT